MARQGIDGDKYWLTEEQKLFYKEKGYLHVEGLLSQEELAPLEIIYNKFINDEVPGLGNDLSDITGEKDKSKESFSAISVMLPSKYYGELKGNVYEKRAAHISAQLEGSDMTFDFDRLIAKKPSRPDAVFHWHQDKLYCGKHGGLVNTDDLRAITVSLAFDQTDSKNGCIHYIPGSHIGNTLRPHVPIGTVQAQQDLMFAVTKTDIDETREEVVAVPLKKGDATFHGDFVVHGSKGNTTTGWRRNYVLAFRPQALIDLQNEKGLTRSHNVAATV